MSRCECMLMVTLQLPDVTWLSCIIQNIFCYHRFRPHNAVLLLVYTVLCKAVHLRFIGTEHTAAVGNNTGCVIGFLGFAYVA
jgi:hypothetical protein